MNRQLDDSEEVKMLREEVKHLRQKLLDIGTDAVNVAYYSPLDLTLRCYSDGKSPNILSEPPPFKHPREVQADEEHA